MSHIDRNDLDLIMDEICRAGFDPTDSPLGASHYVALTVHTSNLQLELDRMRETARIATRELMLARALLTYEQAMRDTGCPSPSTTPDPDDLRKIGAV